MFFEDKNSASISSAVFMLVSLVLSFSSQKMKSGVDLLWWIDGAIVADASTFIEISFSTKFSKSSMLLFFVVSPNILLLHSFWCRFGGNIELTSSSKVEQLMLLGWLSLTVGISIIFCWKDEVTSKSMSIKEY